MKLTWINVNFQLPEDTRDVLCCGVDGGKAVCEVGFRSIIDDPRYPEQWADFYFLVLFWADIPYPFKLKEGK